MEDIGVALALVLVIEGSLYALFPESMRNAMQEILKMPTDRLRMAGLFCLCFGALLVWLIKG